MYEALIDLALQERVFEVVAGEMAIYLFQSSMKTVNEVWFSRTLKVRGLVQGKLICSGGCTLSSF